LWPQVQNKEKINERKGHRTGTKDMQMRNGKEGMGRAKKVKGKRREQGNLRRKGMVSNWKKNSNEA
jgi:hypothetical protein